MDYINKEETRAAERAESPLQLIFGDVTLGIRGRAGKGNQGGVKQEEGEREQKVKTLESGEFHYIFSYVTGGLESLAVNGREWLYRTPRPTFWRATTDNDRGSKFHLKSGMWLAADMFIQCTGIAVAVDGKEIPFPCAPENNRYTGKERAKRVKITFIYQTVTVPAAKVMVAYEVEGDGRIHVTSHYYGVQGLPELPVFGLRFIMPSCAERFVYKGLSGETYPDRKAGGVPGIYEVEGLPVTPYLVSQDCGVHMDTEWVEIYRNIGLDNSKRGISQPSKLRFDLGKLAFSCLPYTASELENATHQEELPLPRRTVLCIYGAVRGVGGIDSWGADVEPAYHIDGEKDMGFEFWVSI